MLYTLLVKSGSDGQTGRGSNAKKGKLVNDNKWWEIKWYLLGNYISIIFSYNGAVCLLKLTARNDSNDDIWINPRPAGDDFMRPHLISYETETEDMVNII